MTSRLVTVRHDRPYSNSCSGPGSSGAGAGDRVGSSGPTGHARVKGISGGRADHPREPHCPAGVFFLGAAQATNVRSEERIIDLVKLELNKQSIACVAVSPRGTITPVRHDGRGGDTSRSGRTGPRRRSAPRTLPKDAAQLEAGRAVFPRSNEAIGVLAVDMQPLFWHFFDLHLGDPSTAILAAYSTLRMLGGAAASPYRSTR